MSDEQYAFDDWEEAAEKIEKKQEEQKDLPTEQEHKDVNDATQQQSMSQTKVEDPKETLRQRIKGYSSLEREDIEKKFSNMDEESLKFIKNPSQLILKSEKDFIKFARQIAQRLAEESSDKKKDLDENNIAEFLDELLLMIYRGLDWNNLHQVMTKMKAIKTQRKQLQRAAKKVQKKTEITKKEEDQLQINIKDKTQAEDVFGGAGRNLKQEQEAEKQKQIPKEAPKQEEVKKPAVQDDDDDDFM